MRREAIVKEPFDRFCWLVLLASCTALIVLLAGTGAGRNGKVPGLGKAAEREMAYLARIELIERLYAPVERLIATGNRQEALLKLDGLLRQYPGEAHGHILQAEILREMGADDEAIASFVRGIKLNGEYLDDRSPLSRRKEIQTFVSEVQRRVGARVAASPDNRTAAATQQQLGYIRSRLAGGCE